MFAPSNPRQAGAQSGSGQCVLGVDPGLTRCGYAVLVPGSSGSALVRAIGVLRTDRADATPQRLADLAADIESLLDEFSPTAVAVERVFFQNNATTAMGTAQASAIVLLAARNYGIDVVHYTPSQVKLAVAGSGSADKAAIRAMVRKRLGLSCDPSPTDAADAAAVALCHLASAPLARAVSAGRT